MHQKAAFVWLILGFLCISHLAYGTLSPSNKNKKAKSAKDVKVKSGPQPDSVIDRNLVEEEPMARDIIVENAAYYKDTKNRLFNGTVLGYVTPVIFCIEFSNSDKMFLWFVSFLDSGTITVMTWQRFGVPNSM